MKITIIQDNIVFGNKAANLQRVETHLQTLAGKTELVVLPEMFTTGFCTDKPEFAEAMQGETVQKLQRWAIDFNLAIAGSFIVGENQKLYNRGFFVFPDGKIETADKRHLFSLSGEDKLFSAGNKRLIVNYLGFKILLLVCYDLRFPVWSRCVNNEYDLAIYVANFPQSRINVWDVLLKARAIENQCYVCGVNITDTDNYQYNGHSNIYDFKGFPLLSFAENEIKTETVEILIEPLQKFREKNAFWCDADKFELRVEN